MVLGSFDDPEQVAKSIQKAVRSSYRLDKVMEDAIDTILATSITVIQTFQKQIKEIDKSITRIMADLQQTLQTVPGLGPVFTAGIIAEIGRKKQSGRFTAGDTSLSQNGNQYLRYCLVEAANSIRWRVPEYSAYYTKKYKEVPKHQHKRALALTARKLVRRRYMRHK